MSKGNYDFAPTAVLKFGGSIITRRDRYCTIDRVALTRCAKAIASWVTQRQSPLIVVLGGGSFGHNVVKRHGLGNDGLHARSDIAFRLTGALFELKVAFAARLSQFRVASLPLQESTVFRSRGDGVIAPGRWAIEASLRCGYIPILSGGLIVGSEERLYPMSSDRVLLPLCLLFGLRRVVMFTDQPGVLRRNCVVSRISVHNVDRILPHLQQADRIDVTGGMRGKIDAALELARHGVETVITDGRCVDDLAIANALSATPAGTLVIAEQRRPYKPRRSNLRHTT